MGQLRQAGVAGALGRPALWSVLTAACAFAVFAPTIGFSLLWDDPPLLRFVEGVVARAGPLGLLTADFRLHPEQPLGYYRPWVLLSLWADSLVARLLPQAFHLTNVLLHAATTVLVFHAARLLVPGPGAAVAAALLFAVHPVHAEAVAFVSARTDLWASLFVLLAALPWLAVRCGAGPSLRAGVLWSSGAFALALLSKESALAFPAVLLAWGLLEPGPAAARGRFRELAPWLAGWSLAAALVLLLRVGVAGVGFGATGAPGGPAPPPRPDFSLLAGAWATTLRLLWFPWPLVPYYDAGRIALSAGSLAAAGATLLLCALETGRAHARIGARGLAWMVLFLVPVSGIVPLGGAPVAERFLYLPSVGFCLVAGHAAWRLRLRGTLGKGLIPAGVLALGLLAAVTVRGSGFWRDEVSFQRRRVELSPGSLFDRVALAELLGRRGLREEAIAEYRRALRTWPDDPTLHINMGRTLLEAGKFAEAAQVSRRATELRPGAATAWNCLGVALAETGRAGEALGAFERALAADPGFDAARDNLRRLRGLAGGGHAEPARAPKPAL